MVDQQKHKTFENRQERECKRCGNPLVPVFGCFECAREEACDRAEINWRGLNAKQIIKIERIIRNKYKDAHLEG